ncbi:MAG: alpha-hydroxy acid oxidase [Aliarcobacter sp.]|nr:alpha-hydroxy acid oxidase [Aliarcobacter sp.]
MDFNSLAYICSGAADEITYKRNNEAFKNIFLETKTLEDLSGANTKIELFGQTYESPIFLAPVAYQKLVDTNGEIATAQAANAMNTCMCVSSFSSCTLEDISASTSSPLWFQLYIQPDMKINLELIKKAESLGFKALVITIDAPISGIRNTEQKAGFYFPNGISAINIENLNSNSNNAIILKIY